MRAAFFASIACAIAALLASCASGAQGLSTRQALARQIADDAAAFNEAYAQATSAQILLNILRSRDRLPRQYLAMTGISDSPSWRYRQNAGVGAIPLGEGASPWGLGSAGFERETQTRPSYAVQPYAAETLARAAFEPTQPHIFARYWRSGWPRDLLLLVMVERITLHGAGRPDRVFVNEANEIFEDCAPQIDTGGCDFVRTARAFLRESEADRVVQSQGEGADAICGLVEAYGASRPVRPDQHERCDPVFIVGEDEYRMRLRSLDDMIYYVGELLRSGSIQAGTDSAIEAPVTIRAAGLRGGGRGVPLFRVASARSAPQRIYAAEVSYGGRRYVAGPAIGRSCGAPAEAGPCQDNAEEGDRSSSVLSLIGEILALNQSPDAIRPPNRLIAD